MLKAFMKWFQKPVVNQINMVPGLFEGLDVRHIYLFTLLRGIEKDVAMSDEARNHLVEDTIKALGYKGQIARSKARAVAVELTRLWRLLDDVGFNV